MERLQSKKLFEQATHVIPGGVNSPVRSFPHLGISPMIVESGSGDLIYDADGHAYIDFCMSWGALILGHAPSAVVKAVQERVAKGSSFGVTSKEEIEIATWMTSKIPSIEKVRFVSSGTEAVMTAIRLARAFTKEKYIIKFDGNYHGHNDTTLVKAGSYLHAEAATEGVLEDAVKFTLSLPYNDLEFAKRFFETFHKPIAAILIEPVAGNMGVVPATPEFLKFLREKADEKKALLVFDEVISFFRVGLLGAQGIYGVQPDLTCFGKIIGGGFPAAAVGGSCEIMDLLAPIGKVFQAGTLSGNPVAMIGGLTTLKEIEKENFYETLDAKLERFIKPIQEAIKKHKYPACIQAQGSMFTLFFGATEIKTSHDLRLLDHEMFKRFFQYLFVHGVYIPPSQQEASFISSAHTDEHLAKASELIIKFFEKYAH